MFMFLLLIYPQLTETIWLKFGMQVDNDYEEKIQF